MRNAERERNREQDPEFAAWVDSYRKVFGTDCRVTWFKKANLERGKYR